MKKILVIALTVLICPAFAQVLPPSGDGVVRVAVYDYRGFVLDDDAQRALMPPEEVFMRSVVAYEFCFKSDTERRARLFSYIQGYLENGGNVNVRDQKDDTALHFAAQFGDLELMTLLFKYNIEAKVKDNAGRTPLHLARKYSRRECAKALVDYDKELPKIEYVPVQGK